MLIQFTGLSGAGKSTLSTLLAQEIQQLGHTVKVIDADQYRPLISSDLGFTAADRKENVRRLAEFANYSRKKYSIVLMVAMNPFEDVRMELVKRYKKVKTIWINCDLETLKARDTKGLYARTLLEDENPDKISNLSGVDETFEEPQNADLVVNTHLEDVEESKNKILNFIIETLK